LRDRGFFLIFAPVTAAAFVLDGNFTSPPTKGLVIGMLLAIAVVPIHRPHRIKG